MQYTTKSVFVATLRVLPVRVHWLAALCFVGLLALGYSLQASAGWSVWPPAVYAVSAPRRRHRCRACEPQGCASVAWQWATATWRVPLVRSLVLGALWGAGGRRGPLWIVAWPWARWVCQGAALLWPRAARRPEWHLLQQVGERGERMLLWGCLGLVVWQGLTHGRALGFEALAEGPPPSAMALVCAGPCVVVRHEVEQRVYQAELEGHLTLRVADDDPFRLRLLILFLRLLEDQEERRGSRRTRDGRTPLVRQQYLAETLGIPQPDISRWERYWQARDWRRLLSQKTPAVLTLELQQRIIETWAHGPSWSSEELRQHLLAQRVAVSKSQIHQAAHESGWEIVRQVLGRLCMQRAEQLRLHSHWLVGDLLAQVQTLLEKVERGQALTVEEHLDVKAWQAAAQDAGLQAKPVPEAQPWLRRVEQVLFAPWSELKAEGVSCPECGSSHVGRKGRKGRVKRFVDEHGQVQEVEVYRYRCHNPACSRKSFTLYPAGSLPYSRQRLEVHVLALQMYAWGYSTYRRTGQALGVASMTAYRWVSAFGNHLLPVAALFGMVKSSGIVGVDEKWVLVPKNHKPAGDQRKWMYVYVAVDVYTYDLLHIAIYPHNTMESAQTFLLALRGKGYHPRVVVTDLRQDYGPAIARVFPQAQHHECLLHASKALRRLLAEIYGWKALRNDAQVLALCQAFDAPLKAETQSAALQHYAVVMARREECVRNKPAVDAVFASLEAHWPKLLNGIESDLIPRTNNTTELVIRRFAQHYRNFCGFEGLQSAERYLGVFEKLYRFTPFTQDAQPRIRGRSPLQLAGYDVTKLPMTAACSGWAIHLPIRTSQQSVPNA